MRRLLSTVTGRLTGAVSLAWLISAASAAPATPDPLTYIVLVTGTELLQGAYADAHIPFITRQLRPLGADCVGALIVGDQARDLKTALGYAMTQVPLVLVTGGLGPTPNDITREVISEVTGIPLREHPRALAEMARRFSQPQDQLRPNLRRQTLVPVRGDYLENSQGTAVGLVFEHSPALIIALPGPPRELQPMVMNQVVPFLSRRYGTREPGASLTLRFVGLGQSVIDQTLKDRAVLDPDMMVSSQFEGGRVDFTFTLPGHGPSDVARLNALEAKIRRHLGDAIYSNDNSSLEDRVVEQFLARKQTLAVVEVGTGGQLAAGLGAASRAPQVLVGAYSAPTCDTVASLFHISPARWRRLTSDEARVRYLARAAMRLTHGSQVLVLYRSVPSPGAKPVTWFALGGSADRLKPQPLSLQETGEISRSRMLTQILDMIRKQLP
jgi:nicotinamide-nucleotide amidase